MVFFFLLKFTVYIFLVVVEMPEISWRKMEFWMGKNKNGILCCICLICQCSFSSMYAHTYILKRNRIIFHTNRIKYMSIILEDIIYSVWFKCIKNLIYFNKWFKCICLALKVHFQNFSLFDHILMIFLLY